MTVRARVISTDGDIAEIEVERRSMCDGCKKNDCSHSCAVSGLVAGSGTVRTRALNKAGAQTGDTVELESSDSRVLLSALVVFIVPIIVCMLFYYAAWAAGSSERLSVLWAAAGFVLSFAVIGLLERVRRGKLPDICVVKIVEHGDYAKQENN